MKLLSLVYSSIAVAPFDQPALQLLLHRARAHNQIVGITGLLLYRNRHFVQALQGPEADVEALYENICRDPRHHSVTTLLKEHVSELAFPYWAMGYLPMELGSDGVMVYSRAPDPLVAAGAWSQDAATRLIHHFQRAFNGAGARTESPG